MFDLKSSHFVSRRNIFRVGGSSASFVCDQKKKKKKKEKKKKNATGQLHSCLV